MANIVVRGIPEDVKDRLDETAKRQRRSVNQTVILAIEDYIRANTWLLDANQMSLEDK